MWQERYVLVRTSQMYTDSDMKRLEPGALRVRWRDGLVEMLWGEEKRQV